MQSASTHLSSFASCSVGESIVGDSYFVSLSLPTFTTADHCDVTCTAGVWAVEDGTTNSVSNS